jgi:D-alanyl-D-alanine dipeptidase
LKTIVKIVFFSFFIVACNKKDSKILYKKHIDIETVYLPIETKSSLLPFEKLLLQYNFVNIKSIDSTILCDLRYSTTNNFVGIDMYGDFNACYVPLDIAMRLHEVQKTLQLIDSAYSLVILDAVRPQHIQQIMWDSCTYSGRQKKNFLAHPSFTSLHNYGAAVDVTLAYNGIEVDMGTPYDFAGETAYTYIENELLTYNKISKEQYYNRQLLRSAMKKQGFIDNNYEWWHFGACYRSHVSKKYPFIVSFDSIIPISNNSKILTEGSY